MPLITHVTQYSCYNYVIEDPESPRIFIEQQSFNTKDLSPRLGEFFDFTYNDGVVAPTGGSANWYDRPVIYTNGFYGNSWSDGIQAWPDGAGRWDPWILSLDYSVIPKRIFRHSKNNLVHMFYPRDITTNNLRQDIRVSKELTDDVAMRQTTNDLWLYVLYERQDGTIIGFNQENNVNYVALMDFQIGLTTQSPATISAVNLQGTANILNFFIGTDTNNYIGYFLAYNCSTHAYNIYAQGDVTTTNGENSTGFGGNSLRLAAGTGGYTNICYQFPSNVIKIAENKKVFYSSHWNASGILSPRLITWDIESGSFSAKNCTLIYPGTNTYVDYGAPPSNTGFSAATNNTWWAKPHVFTIPGISAKFITFCTLEKCVQYFYNSRWFASQQQRNWITFSFDDSDPSTLNYHSHFEWPNTWEFPRSWVPGNHHGNEMLVMQNGKTVYMEFDLNNGWEITNTQSIDARAYGIDSEGRIYLITRGLATSRMTGGTADTYRGVGWNSIYYFDRNNPYNLRVKYQSGDGDQKSVTIINQGQAYAISGDPGIFPTLRRGVTYRFDVTGVDATHPLAIRYNDGDLNPVDGAPIGNSVNGAYGTIFYFTPPFNAPNTMYYQCINHASMIGTLNIVDAPYQENVIEILNDGFIYSVVGYHGNFPTIILRKGQRYRFDVSSVSEIHPVAIRLSNSDTTAIPWISETNAVSGDHKKIIEFVVPYNAPDTLVYQCRNHSSMIGNITVIDAAIEVSIDNRKIFSDFGNTMLTTLHPFSTNNPTFYSYSFDGNDRVWTSNNEDFNFRTGDFTVEFWIWSRVAWASQTNLMGVVGQKTSDTPWQGWQIYKNNTQSTKMAVRYAGNNDFYSTENVGTQTWEHWALVRRDGTMYWYKNGTECGSVASTHDIYDYTANFFIAFSQTWSVHFNGIISNLRICKGLAVYTGNFTAPDSPLEALQSSGTNISMIDGECVLLTAKSNRFEDLSALISNSVTLSTESSDLFFLDENNNSNSALTVVTDKNHPIIVPVRRTSGNSLADINAKLS
jgi:hypothetical protein